MAQIKMKYGIDLGTTNSAICKMENGEPVIKKTDTLKDTLPSCIAFSKKRVISAGDSAYRKMSSDKAKATKTWNKGETNVFLEFKRTMGLDTKYESPFMGRSFSSEELSAEVLKALKSFVSDDNISACVITIPAKFKTDQIAATKRAATLAGIDHCELLQEPIAASMAYGLSSAKKDGIWLVFDFGGGTFDAALLKVEDGIMQVKDTEGDNYLGGKNLDYAVVDGIIIPFLQENFCIDDILGDDTKKQILRDALKPYAEKAKNYLSFNPVCDDVEYLIGTLGTDDYGEELDLTDMVVTQEQLKQVVEPIFQKAIDICKKLLSRNNLSGRNLDSLILVGGPTYSPILRSMLKNQVTPNVDTSIDPMTAVAKGAALFASGIDTEAKRPNTATGSATGTVALELAYESSSVETVEFVSIRLLPEESTGTIPSHLFVELTRNDKGWSSGKVEINDIGDVIECQLMEGKANSFTIVAYDEKGNTVPCFPNEVNIMQGIVVGSAVLPYNIGIEAYDSLRSKEVFVPLKGLEKNQPIPAIGVRNGLKTPKQLRPGMTMDRLVIPIYQGEHNAEGSSAIYNDHVTDIIITGDDIPTLIPQNSDLDITVKVDRSQMMTVEVTFPFIGETIEKEIDVNQRAGVDEKNLEERLEEARNKLKKLQESPGIMSQETSEAQAMLTDISNRFDGEKGSEDGKMHLLADLRRTFLKMEETEKSHEWEMLETNLRKEFADLERANNELGNKYDAQVADLRRRMEMVIRKQDVQMGHQILDEIISLYISVTFIYQLIGRIRKYHNEFRQIKWKDAGQARSLLNQGLEIIGNNPSEDALHPIVVAVIDLMDIPEGEKPRL